MNLIFFSFSFSKTKLSRMRFFLFSKAFEPRTLPRLHVQIFKKSYKYCPVVSLRINSSGERKDGTHLRNYTDACVIEKLESMNQVVFLPYEPARNDRFWSQ